MNRNTKLEPAPLSGKSHLSPMKSSNTLQKKQTAELSALEAEYAAKRAALEHKHSQESQAKPSPIVKPGKVTVKAKGPDLSKYPKGK